MTEYYFYITPEFNVEASIMERDGILICSLDCDDTESMMHTIELFQRVMDATLLQLDENRKKISKYATN